MNKYYVYFHINPVNNQVFYVGKGTGNRAYVKRRRSKYWNSYVDKYGYLIKIIESNLTNQQAFEREIFHISSIGRENLVNLTDGGEGCKIPWNKGKKGIYTEDQLKAMKVKKRCYTEEEKLTKSESMKGKNTWMKGRKHSIKTLEKMKGRTAWNKCLKSTTPRDENGRFTKNNNDL